MLIDKRLAVVEHEKTTVLFNQITSNLDALSASIQAVFEHVDPCTDAAVEVTERLAAMNDSVTAIRQASLDSKLESDYIHSSLIKVQKELPEVEKQLQDLQVRIGRQSKRHAEHEKNAALTRRYAGVKW